MSAKVSVEIGAPAERRASGKSLMEEADLEAPLPRVEHVYQSAMLDSLRWERYTPREDDVVVASSYKSGTTLTMNIVRRLIYLGREAPPYEELWPDSRFRGDLDALMARLETISQRRYLKTHLPLDGLPYYPQVKYVVPCRDPRDVFMSFWNHYHSMSKEFLEYVNGLPGRVGPPTPLCPEDIHQVWRDWIGRGWFQWETEGYPWWGNMRQVQSWWDFRNLDNILFVHFADLLADLPGQVQRIATYLEIDLPQGELPGVMDALSLGSMRDEAAANDPEFASWFYNKGTNGRWRGVLSTDELEMYERKAAEVLDPECRAWLEHQKSGKDCS